MAANQYSQYVVRNTPDSTSSRDFSSLVKETVSIPLISDNDVLVRIRAVSLNWRDVMVATNTYIWPLRDGVVPCSDGAGEVISFGSKVTRFNAGDRVAALFTQTHLSGPMRPANAKSALGAAQDGMLREYAVLNEQGLVHIPDHLSYEEASTLPCAGVTAWNALMGGGRRLKAGDSLLTQGTGGVSMFAAQFGVAAGAQVISTSSSARKLEIVKRLGVHHVMNYHETLNWGAEAKKLTPEGEGADFVVEIGGPATIQQSLQAVKIEGTIAIIGQRSKQDPGNRSEKDMALNDAFRYVCTMRRIVVGSRELFEEMNRSIAVNKIRPVVDERVFGFDEAREAFKYLADGKHVGNVVIRISSTSPQQRL